MRKGLYKIKEGIVQFPRKQNESNKYRNQSEFLSVAQQIVNDFFEDNPEQSKKVETFDFDLHFRNPGIWYNVRCGKGREMIQVLLFGNQHYVIQAIPENMIEDEAEWIGEGLDEFAADFREAISLDWT